MAANPNREGGRHLEGADQEVARLGRGDPVDVPPGEGRVQHESEGRLQADESQEGPERAQATPLRLHDVLKRGAGDINILF